MPAGAGHFWKVGAVAGARKFSKNGASAGAGFSRRLVPVTGIGTGTSSTGGSGYVHVIYQGTFFSRTRRPVSGPFRPGAKYAEITTERIWPTRASPTYQAF